MIAEIIPWRKLPRKLAYFSYLVPQNLEDKLKIGQVVTIPLRKSMIRGIVAKISAEHESETTVPRKLKAVAALNADYPLYTEKQIKLFFILGEKYYVSPTVFIRHNTPRGIDKIKKTDKEICSQKQAPYPRSKKQKTAYVHLAGWDQAVREVKEKLTRYPESDEQILIMVPKTANAEKLITDLKLNENNYKKIISELNEEKMSRAWFEAINGEIKIFIGTKKAIFFPYIKLREIVVVEEEAADYKQTDMTPRYDLRAAAKIVGDINGAKITFFGFCPSVEYWQKYPKHEKKVSNNKTEIIDLNNEIIKKNFSFVSEKTTEEINVYLKDKKKIFIFLNKKGIATNTFCKDCGFLFKCPKCGWPLKQEKDGQLSCYYCQYSEEMPPFCPKCQGANFYSKGIGGEKLKNNLQKIWPQSQITLINKNTGMASREKIAKCDIVIGTEYALPILENNLFDLAVVIKADELWQQPEYGAAEKGWFLLTKLINGQGNGTKIIIQTFSPDHHIIRAVKNNDANLFYEKELECRKAFDYPPYSQIIKLSVLGKQKNKVLAEANKIFTNLKSNTRNGIEISEPIPTQRGKVRGQYKINIIVKINTGIKQSDFPIKHIPNHWLIDVGAKTLLD